MIKNKLPQGKLSNNEVKKRKEGVAIQLKQFSLIGFQECDSNSRPKLIKYSPRALRLGKNNKSSANGTKADNHTDIEISAALSPGDISDDDSKLNFKIKQKEDENKFIGLVANSNLKEMDPHITDISTKDYNNHNGASVDINPFSYDSNDEDSLILLPENQKVVLNSTPLVFVDSEDEDDNIGSSKTLMNSLIVTSSPLVINKKPMESKSSASNTSPRKLKHNLYKFSTDKQDDYENINNKSILDKFGGYLSICEKSEILSYANNIFFCGKLTTILIIITLIGHKDIKTKDNHYDDNNYSYKASE